MAEQLLDDAEVGLGKGEGAAGGGAAPLYADHEVGIAAKPQDPRYMANFGAGANEWLADAIGAPVDAVAKMLSPKIWNSMSDQERSQYRQDHPASAAIMEKWSDALKKPAGGSDSIKNLLGVAGIDPRDVVATTPGEKVARAAGAGTAGMVAPGLAAEAKLGAGEQALAKAWEDSNSFGNAALEILKGGGAASNAAIGAAAGAGGEAAAQAAPEPYQPLARLAGGVAGGAAAAGAAGLGEAALGAGKRASQWATEPAEVRAARTLLSKATDQGGFRAALDEAAGETDMVPGSKPTTFQATGDMGVGALERGVQASSQGVAQFAARRADQNAARLEALRGLADPEASADAVSQFVKDRLDSIIGDHAARVAAASDRAADALAAAGGEGQASASQYGEALRAPLRALHQEAKAEAGKLWRAIDPDMKVQVDVGGFKDAVADTLGQVSELARGPEGEEAAIYKAVEGMGDRAPFGDVVALRSRLTDAIRTERQGGNGTALRRLSITLGDVDDLLANTAGRVVEEATPAERQGLLERLQAEAKAWQNRARQGVGVADTGEVAAEGAGAVAGGRPRAVPAAPGAEGEAGSGLGASEGAEGAPAGGAVPEDLAARYAAARGATKQVKQTFESGPVGAALRPGEQAGSFSMMPSNVPKNLFDKPEALAAFAKAAGGDPEIMGQMQDYAAFSLRKAAVRDGKLDAGRYAKWMDENQHAVDMFPGLKEKFDTAAKAQEALDAALGNQKEALTAFQNGAAKRLLAGQDPAAAAGRALGNPKEFGELVDAVKGDAAASAGLKRAVVDHMFDKTLAAAEAGASGQPELRGAAFAKFVDQNEASLGKLFSPEELQSMKAVAADVQRANRSITAVRIPGGSNTAQDTPQVAMQQASLLERVVAHAVGTLAGTAVGHPFLGFVAGQAASSFRAARMDSVRDALVELMLNPKLAAEAVRRVPQAQAPRALEAFADRMRAATFNQVVSQQLRGNNAR